MACLIVPATEAIVTTIVKKSAVKSAEKKGIEIKNPFLKKMNWLNNMLWGGSALLAFEHVWHGEIVPWFPFLTNAATPESTMAMLGEMATSGVAMALLVTAVWAGIVAFTNVLKKKPIEAKAVVGGKA